MGKAKEKRAPKKFGPTAGQMIAENNTGLKRRVPKVVAYEERCTSPLGKRQFVHKTDVINGDINAAKERSNTFVSKYEKQGWGVIVRAVME